MASAGARAMASGVRLQDGAGVAVTRSGQSAGAIAIGEPADGESWDVWPQIVRVGRNDESALVGVARVNASDVFRRRR